MNRIYNPWDQLMTSGNIELNRTDEGITIHCPDASGAAFIKDTFSLPLRIDLTAETDSTNIRLLCGAGQFIVNWEVNTDEVRYNDPFTGLSIGIFGENSVPVDEYVRMTWILDHEYTIV